MFVQNAVLLEIQPAILLTSSNCEITLFCVAASQFTKEYCCVRLPVQAQPIAFPISAISVAPVLSVQIFILKGKKYRAILKIPVFVITERGQTAQVLIRKEIKQQRTLRRFRQGRPTRPYPLCEIHSRIPLSRCSWSSFSGRDSKRRARRGQT